VQVYEKVCTHQHISTEWLDRALGKDEKKGKATPFAEFCDKARQLKACRKLDLAAFLIKPFQRITKYPLLLRVPTALPPTHHHHPWVPRRHRH
jgi:hypothetical protein